jgi:HD-GYP domain-containing protein (c-di-GMP phosphodiesterase class II)
MTIPSEPAPVSSWHALRALTLGLDLAMGRPPGHGQAVAALSRRIGHRLGLGETDRDELVLAALLKDAG